MVTFRGRGTDTISSGIEVSVSSDDKTIFISSGLKPVSMAVESFFKSDRLPTVSTHQVSAKFGFDGNRLTKRTFTITQYKSDDGLLSPDKTEENAVSEVRVVCTPDGEGTRITLSGQTTTDDLAFGDGLATVGEIASELADFISVEREEAALGYGPQHPLEDIQPQSITEDQIPTGHDEAVELFSPWINETLNRSRVNDHEFGFYNDWGNNTVGIFSGDMRSVSFPHTLVGEMNFSLHTHPRIRSAPTPSNSDIQFMTAHRTGAITCIARGLYNTYFAPTVEDDEGSTALLDDGGVTYNTFTETSLVTYEVVSGDRVTDIDEYVEEFVDRMEDIVRLDEQLAVDQVRKHKGELDEQVTELVIDNIQSTADNFVDHDEDERIEVLKGAYKVENKALVPKYHVFPIDQDDKKPVRHI